MSIIYEGTEDGHCTVTDFIIEAVRLELEKHRHYIDSNPDLRSVSLLIKIDRKNLRPRAVVFQPQVEREI